MSDVHRLMKYLTPYELDHIKFLAHNDEIPYLSLIHISEPTRH